MELHIKQLKQGSQIIVPQTTAEAVLVKHNEEIIRLDQALALKSGLIITPAGSGLNSFDQNNTVVITHSNIIEPTDTTSPLMIKDDSHGHIIESEAILPLNVIVNGQSYISHTGAEQNVLKLGDDFTTDEENNINLTWTNI